MTHPSKYVGLDVHQATTVAVARDGSGMRAAVHVAFEEGTQAQWLHDVLVPPVARVLVCNRPGESHRGTIQTCVQAHNLMRVAPVSSNAR